MTRKQPAARIALTVPLVVLALALVPVSLAAKGGGATKPRSGGGGSSSLTLAMVADANGNGLPNYGDTVTFKVSTTATSAPEVKAVCTQSGVQVYYHEGGFYPGDPWAPGDQMFTLASYAWTSGAADCIATLFYMNSKGGETDLTSLSFHVDP